MGFTKMGKPQYPPRLWTLAGFPGSGKSTFSTQMRSPLLAIDAGRNRNRAAAFKNKALAIKQNYRLLTFPKSLCIFNSIIPIFRKLDF